MDQNRRRVDLLGSALANVRKILRPDGKLNTAEISRRSWSVGEIDDKSIFDEDARRLAMAFQGERADFFYVVRVCDLLHSINCVSTYRFTATQDEIELFQSNLWHEINLDDCLMFNLPLTCAVLRPGNVDSTKFLGSLDFVRKINKT